ncbi:hypothetical protein QF018_005824, partial [Pseudomonas laurylsulfatiphila]
TLKTNPKQLGGPNPIFHLVGPGVAGLGHPSKTAIAGKPGSYRGTW